jgi:hypothetical protein
MKTKEQMRAEYEHRSELLTIQVRRDEIFNMAVACEQAGKVGLAQDLYKIAGAK